MNLVEQYPNYVKFNDRSIYEAVCDELKMDETENQLIPMQDVLKVEKIKIYSPTFTYFQDIKLLQNLKTLHLYGCNSVNIECLSELKNLRELYIAEGHISITNEFSLLTQLKSLTIRLNCVSDLSPLASLNQLEILNLEYNFIEDVSPLCNLSNLKVLILDSNVSLRNIDPLVRMTNLEFLSLIDINRNKSMKIRNLREALNQNGDECKVIGSRTNGDNIYRAEKVGFEEVIHGYF